MADEISRYCSISRDNLLRNNLLNPDSKIHGTNMGPTWILSAPDGPHVGPMNLAIREAYMPWYTLPCVEWLHTNLIQGMFRYTDVI